MKKGYRLNSLSSFKRLVKQANFNGVVSGVRNLADNAAPLSKADKSMFWGMAGGGSALGGLAGSVLANRENDPNISDRDNLKRRVIGGTLGALGGATAGSAIMGGKWLTRDIKDALAKTKSTANNVPRPSARSGGRPNPEDIDPWTGGPNRPRRPPNGPGPDPWDGSSNPWDD
jgi:hypothetical protein